jgi:hypothetical protein
MPGGTLSDWEPPPMRPWRTFVRRYGCGCLCTVQYSGPDPEAQPEVVEEFCPYCAHTRGDPSRLTLGPPRRERRRRKR